MGHGTKSNLGSHRQSIEIFKARKKQSIFKPVMVTKRGLVATFSNQLWLQNADWWPNQRQGGLPLVNGQKLLLATN